MTRNALILFFKAPEPGKMKTRIARVLGDAATLDLYRCFLLDLAAISRGVEAQSVIVYSGPDGVLFPEFPEVPCLTQRGKDIGERMFNAFDDVFKRGYRRAVLIGSDLPDLPADDVNEAFIKLAGTDVVLGPATDGGYYLVGCNRDSLRRSLFHDIPWSTKTVFPATLRRIEESGLKTCVLTEWSDIDDVFDLKRFGERNKNQEASHTMQYLSNKEILHEL